VLALQVVDPEFNSQYSREVGEGGEEREKKREREKKGKKENISILTQKNSFYWDTGTHFIRQSS
jgi:hypothetical protein